MADVNNTVGVAACDALQREFGKDTVTFIPTDVTDSKQLVSYDAVYRVTLCTCAAEAHVPSHTGKTWRA